VEVTKAFSNWVPPVVLAPQVALFSEAYQRFVALTKQATSYVDQFRHLKTPDKLEIEQLKRHWRAERCKLTDALTERKLPAAVGKTSGDCSYDAVVPAKDIDMRLGYEDITLGPLEVPDFLKPFYIAPLVDDGASHSSMETLCWQTFTTVSQSQQCKDAAKIILDGMKTSTKVRAARLTIDMEDAFPWTSALPTLVPVMHVKPAMQVMSGEYWDVSLRAVPMRVMAGLYQVVSGTFLIIILPQHTCLQHSNLMQHIQYGDSTLFTRSAAFRAEVGSTWFVPFGWTMCAMATTKEFIDVYLGSDSKAKEEWKKVPPNIAHTCSFVVYPLFDCRDAKSDVELKNVCGYAWTQASSFLATSWKNNKGIIEYWNEINREASAAADLDAPPKKASG